MPLSEAESQAQIAALIGLAHHSRDYAESQTPSFVSLFDSYVQLAEGDYAPEALGGVQGVRDRFAGVLSRDIWLASLTAHLRDYAKATLGVPEVGADAIMARLYDRFIDNTLRVTSRQITYGSPAAGGGNVGTGTLVRLTKDENDFNLEACTVEAKTIKCIADYNSGTRKHEEQFEIRGAAAPRDALSLSGSGAKALLRAVSPSDALTYLTNPSFSDYTGTAPPTVLPGWTVGSLANFAIVTGASNTFRDADGIAAGDAANAALQINATETVTQALSVRRAAINPNIPYMLEIAWNRQIGAASGTLEIQLGNASVNVAVAAQTGWQKLRLALDRKLWFKYWNKTDASVVISWTRTGGTLLVDDVTLAPLQPFDGTYWWPIGGATRFLRDDVFTLTDTGGAPATGILQYWFYRLLGRYLPHATGGSVTWVDPS